MKSSRWRRALLLIAVPILVGAAVLLLPIHRPLELTRVAASPGLDSVLLTAGARYRAGAAQRFLLGTHYRELWTLPVKIAVLKVGSFEGGLRPEREGGGMETRSLHFVAATGRRYIFRSIDKEITRLLSYGLSRSALATLVQDQTSSAHPAGVLVASQLQAAAGLPTAHPRLVVLPDDAALGGFRLRFAGLFGTFQEAPGEDPSVPRDSTGQPIVRHTDEMLALLDAGAANQADVRTYLTARLLDFFMNDWDRHGGQWRWVPRREPWGTLWRPVPIDRDQAFAWYDGALLDIARLRTSKLSEFGPRYPHLSGLVRNSGPLDRRLLAGLAQAEWDSTVGFLETRLSDSVIDAAVHAMPEPYWERSGRDLAATLKQRRAGIRAIAKEFYVLLAQQPEVHATAADDVVRVSRRPDGSVELRLSSWFMRRFSPVETNRIDLYLHGPPERFRVTGDQGGIPIRVLDSTGREVPNPARTP
jgi:hypothetical protein